MRARKLLVGIGIFTGSALATTFAYAAWNSSGHGSATVLAKTAVALGVADSATTDALYPGATSGLKVSVTNPNPYAVTISSLDNNGAIAVDAGHPGCLPANVSYTTQSVSPGVVINSGETKTVTVAGGVSMILDANDACQGATFTIPVKAVGGSSAAHS